MYCVTKSKWAFRLGSDWNGGKRTHVHLTMLAGTEGTRLAETKNGAWSKISHKCFLSWNNTKWVAYACILSEASRLYVRRKRAKKYVYKRKVWNAHHHIQLDISNFLLTSILLSSDPALLRRPRLPAQDMQYHRLETEIRPGWEICAFPELLQGLLNATREALGD